MGLLARVAQRVPTEVTLDAGSEIALIARKPLLTILLRGMSRLEVPAGKQRINLSEAIFKILTLD